MTVDSAAARFTAIFDTIREFRLSNMMFEDGEGFYLLVDAMTAEGRSIDDGEEQMRDLAAEIISALDTLAAPASAAEPGWLLEIDDGVIVARQGDVSITVAAATATVYRAGSNNPAVKEPLDEFLPEKVLALLNGITIDT